MKVVKSIYEIPKEKRDKWSKYDLSLASCHIYNWGQIYLDSYDCPMEIEDVDYMLEEVGNV